MPLFSTPSPPLGERVSALCATVCLRRPLPRPRARALEGNCAQCAQCVEAFNECDQCGQCVAGRPAATRAAPRPPWAAHRGGQRQPHSGRPQFEGGPAAQRGRPAARSGRPISGGGRPLFRVRGRPTLFGQRAARFGGWAALVAAGRPARQIRIAVADPSRRKRLIDTHSGSRIKIR